jgi:hypothetical protein
LERYLCNWVASILRLYWGGARSSAVWRRILAAVRELRRGRREGEPLNCGARFGSSTSRLCRAHIRAPLGDATGAVAYAIVVVAFPLAAFQIARLITSGSNLD